MDRTTQGGKKYPQKQVKMGKENGRKTLVLRNNRNKGK